jgi:hypothetical protein
VMVDGGPLPSTMHTAASKGACDSTGVLSIERRRA